MNLDNNKNVPKFTNQKDKFFRWEEWFHYMSLKKSVWNILLWVFLSAWCFVLFITFITLITVFSSEATKKPGIIFAITLTSIILLFLALSFGLWAQMKQTIWNAKKYTDLKIAKHLLMTAIILNPFFLIYLNIINKRQNNLKHTSSFNISWTKEHKLSSVNDQTQTISTKYDEEYGYTNTYEAQVSNFSNSSKLRSRKYTENNYDDSYDQNYYETGNNETTHKKKPKQDRINSN
ncbi:Hypothetical protein, predicted transmembrane protein [Mycoplasmopsis agalactiae 14628]|uniref:Uncharacterized protein n=1 Tax=Mycoplasmopsis agalactiae 14628 TaxID=1110504 RepID=I5D6E6_MYCAA|nr:hypothetical protein [Mycoplasmopsis agalactiae]EIN15255.1 Hypothetical protein, predicted transmembrane protein [Mycoplasmopsis agalactiae 14628]